MAKKVKNPTRREIYTEALGRSLSGLSVVAWQFKSESDQQQAHYELMMSGRRGLYALYDGYRTQAYIIYPQENDAQIKAVLSAYKGKFFEPQMD